MKAQITITGPADNPFNWTNHRQGETFAAEWCPSWGCWVVQSRRGKHTDDYTIRYTENVDINIVDEVIT